MEVRGTLPGNARERGAPTMCSVANVEQGGVEELATSGEEVAGEEFAKYNKCSVKSGEKASCAS